MDKKVLKDLEWEKIEKKLLELSSTPWGKQKVLKAQFSTNRDVVEGLLNQTIQMKGFVKQYGAFPLPGNIDIGEEIKRAEAGGVLSEDELLKIRDILRVVGEIKRLSPILSQSFPELFKIVQTLPCPVEIKDEIERCIGDDGEITDNASPLIGELRKKVRLEAERIRQRIESILRRSDIKGYLQDEFFTIRENRYVIPVKSSFKGRIEGIIHDTSLTGETIFVEPAELVPLNNSLKMAESELKEEIFRVLMYLSDLIGKEAGTFYTMMDKIGELDFIHARGRLSTIIGGTKPVLNENGRLRLLRARHPLLIFKGGSVIPNDIILNEDERCMVISGPNAGGKTVVLKTTGMVLLLTMAGVLPPVDEGSEIPCGIELLTCIESVEGIEEELSAFSAHVLNVIEILKKATPRSIILIDELMGRTDPIEGSALGHAFLDCLLEKGGRLLVTTHYPELKLIAEKGIIPASMEFDINEMKPTYRLIKGVPGNSWAMRIAHRLGLPERIREIAEGYLKDREMFFEEAIRQIDDMRIRYEVCLKDAEEIREELKARVDELNRQMEKFKVDKEKEIREIREKMRRLFEEARKEMNRLIEEAKREKKAELRKKLRESMIHYEKDVMSRAPSIEDDFSLISTFEPGSEVFIEDLNLKGKVVEFSSEDNRLVINSGGKNIVINTGDVKVTVVKLKTSVDLKKKEDEKRASDEHTARIDLRGLRADEAIMRLDTFLDKSYLEGIREVCVVHGIGTGALRRSIREYLSESPYVKGFRAGSANEGGEGVTVIALKD